MSYIDREAAKTAIMNYISEQTVSKYATSADCRVARSGAEGAFNEIDYIPDADVVEVVRCKDCKHYRAYEPPIEDFDGWCSVNENEYDKEFYCQYGERSENGKRTDN